MKELWLHWSDRDHPECTLEYWTGEHVSTNLITFNRLVPSDIILNTCAAIASAMQVRVQTIGPDGIRRKMDERQNHPRSDENIPAPHYEWVPVGEIQQGDEIIYDDRHRTRTAFVERVWLQTRDQISFTLSNGDPASYSLNVRVQRKIRS